MQRTPISSSNLISIGYDPNSQTLEVEFKGGAVYQYFSVPKDEYDSLMIASSQGVYFSTNIRKNYDFEKL